MNENGLPHIDAYDLPAASELPAGRVAWKPERHRCALLIHDMQRYFLRPFAPDAAPIAPAIANIAEIRLRCVALGVPVFYTAQKGGQERRDRGLQADFWGPGMSAAPEHQEITEELAPGPTDIVLEKWRYSAFQRSNLETLMRARGRDQIIICGVYAHIGCLMTAADAFMHDIEPFMVADGLGDFSRRWHDQALAYVSGRCGVVLTAGQLIEDL